MNFVHGKRYQIVDHPYDARWIGCIYTADEEHKRLYRDAFPNHPHATEPGYRQMRLETDIVWKLLRDKKRKIV
jgi:hypothetical protein